MPCVTVSNRNNERGIDMANDIMKYWTKVFKKPYPDGWKDKPNKTTPIRGKVMDAYDSAMDEVDDRVLSLGKSVVDHDFMIEQLAGSISETNKALNSAESSLRNLIMDVGDNLDDTNTAVAKCENDIAVLNNAAIESQKAIAELDDKKITKVYANSDGATVLTDSDNGKIQDMILYGKSEQKQYSGKNLLNMKNAKGGTDVGVTVAINDDGSYSYVGTPTDNNVNVWLLGNYVYDTPILTLAPGKYYVKGVNLYYNSTSIFTGGRNGGFITLTEDTPIAGIGAVSGEVGTSYNETWYPIIAKSDVEVPWEPYVGGIPSPNPDYPQEIKSVVNPTVKVCGKNLFDINNPTKAGYVISSDGTFVENALFNCYRIKMHDNGMTISWVKGSKFDAFRYGTEKDGIITRFTTQGLSQTIKSDGVDAVWISIIPEDDVQSEIMVSAGTDVVPYIPYTEQTVTLPFTLNAIPVSEGGNITIDGQQYIADYVDVERKKLVRCIGFFNGNVFSYDEPTKKRWRYDYDNAKIKTDTSKIYSLCNKYPYATNDGNNTYRTGSSKYSKSFLIYADADADLSDVVIYTALEVPTETDLTDEQVNALKALSTYYPTTNVAVTSDELDGYVTFDYPLCFESAAEYAVGSLQFAFESGLPKSTFRIYGSDSKESMYDIRIVVFDSNGVAKQLTQFSLYAYGGKSVGNGTVNTSYGVIRQNGSGYVQLETKADYNWKVWISGKGWRVEKV